VEEEGEGVDLPHTRAEALRRIEVTGVPAVRVPWGLILAVGLGLVGVVAMAVIVSHKKL
jgi:mannitol/fructose-specific phosphotransferase system IIA component